MDPVAVMTLKMGMLETSPLQSGELYQGEVSLNMEFIKHSA